MEKFVSMLVELGAEALRNVLQALLVSVSCYSGVSVLRLSSYVELISCSINLGDSFCASFMLN